MGKSKQTLDLEQTLYNAVMKKGVYGCFEVTLDIGGNERVDRENTRLNNNITRIKRHECNITKI